MQKMIEFAHAIELIQQEEIPEMGSERVNFISSIDRVLSEDIFAKENLPQVPLSSMDGYAFAYGDAELLGSVGLRVMGDNPAGKEMPTCQKGCVIKTFTGSVMPKNTDTMILVEDVEFRDDRIFSRAHSKLPKKGQWVRDVGSNYQKGELLLPKSSKITPYEIGLLAELNCNFVSVYQKPRVGVLVSGNEIIEVGEEQKHPGEVRSVNNHLLRAMIEKMGAQATIYQTLGDDFVALESCFIQMLRECDLVLTTGGMSKGDYDFTQDVVLEHCEGVFKGVRMKPGKPLLFARAHGSKKPVLGLPGNPNAVAVTFYLFGRMLLAKMFAQRCEPIILRAELQEDLIRTDARLEFRACALSVCDGRYCVSGLAKANFSALINNLCGNRALVILEENGSDLKKGSQVPIILFKEFS
ncbi:molybdopterin biosynthesis protein [Helicobacter mustelae]|uniref:molybdopterin molybdotransferase MoeA n=1 Tax=Helicobacter mustelae TaxID=217 RepID=UPI000E0101F7|nr:molybdopterin molybdotransferase MoeA [Helicobacter mustelae]STP12573.1 molybdopterin biosynthesis protein [Helicobacter mustelae]